MYNSIIVAMYFCIAVFIFLLLLLLNMHNFILQSTYSSKCIYWNSFSKSFIVILNGIYKKVERHLMNEWIN